MSGVRQGCILSPLLFSMYINEFVNEINNAGVSGIELLNNDCDINSLLYADDLSILGDTVINLQRKINILAKFCEKWNLKVNPTKSKIIVFRRGGFIKSSEKWFYNNQKIDIVSYYSYLGMIFSSRLCWTKCLESYACKATRLVHKLRYILDNINYIDAKIALKIFDTKVKPILLYGAEIWGTSHIEIIEKIQIKFCKMFLGIGKTTLNTLTLVELRRYSLCVDYMSRSIKYWCKLLRTGNYRFNKKCYLQEHKVCENNRDCNNWASKIKFLLCSTGFGYAWYAQDVGNIDFFIRLVKDRLMNMDIQRLNASTNFCGSYYELPRYLSFKTNRNTKRMFTLLRTKSLPIRNNLYRINVVSDMFCCRCTMAVIDDEFHFLFECPYFNVLRNNYDVLTKKLTPNILLDNVLSCNDITMFKQVTEYIIASKICDKIDT